MKSADNKVLHAELTETGRSEDYLMLSQPHTALRWIAFALFTFLFAIPTLTPALAQGRGAAPGLLSAPGGGDGLPPQAMAAMRSRFVDVQLDGLAKDTVLVDLFEDVSITATRDTLVGDPASDFIWTGQIAGVQHSRVIVSVRHGVAAAVFRWPGALYEVRALPNGRYVLHQIDPDALPPHINPRTEEPQPRQETQTQTAQEPAIAGDAGDMLDLMVVYTPAARAAHGGAAGIEALIDLAITDANIASQNSAIASQLRLVHVAEVNYTEPPSGMGTSLDNLTYNDGVIDEVHSWRDTYGADLVAMITRDTNYCGIAWVLQGVSNSFAPYGFSVTYSGCLTSQTLAHELGHNRGSAHNRENASVNGAFPYSYGLRNNAAGWYTVMSYSCSGCVRVDHFSNPSVLYGGVATGIDYDEDPANAADNARSISNTDFTVANFRTSAPLDPPAAPSGLVATAASDSTMDLAWTNNATSQSGFEIERSGDGVGGWSLIAAVGASATSYTDTSLAPSTAYFYQVRAYNSAGNSTWSNIANATTNAPAPFVDDVAFDEVPIAGSVGGTFTYTTANDGTRQQIAERQSGGRPQNRYSYLEHEWLIDVAGGSAVTLFANVHADASSDSDTFVFTYSTDGVTFTDMFEVTNTSDADNYYSYALPASTNGVVHVRVFDTDQTPGNKSLDTVYVDHMYIRSDVIVGGEPPVAPTALVTTAVSAGTIDLDWTDNSADEYGFKVERSLNGANWSQVTTTGAGVSAFTDTGLDPDTTYWYRVAAFNGAGNSSWSNAASAATPQGIAIQANGYKVKGKHTVDLSWGGAAGASVVVHRDDGNAVMDLPIANDGWHTDAIGAKGGGMYIYTMCEADNPATCSDPAMVVF